MNKEEMTKFATDRYKYFIKYYKLNSSQQNRFNSMRISMINSENNLAGLYTPEENELKLNSLYFKAPQGVGISETIFHELSHAKDVYDTGDGLQTGIMKNVWQYQNLIGDEFPVTKGTALTESAACYYGEMAEHSFNKSIWIEKPYTNQFFPRHKFPSKYKWYQQSGNFHSQFASVLGISDFDLCQLVSSNEQGRKVLMNGFEKLTDDPNAFDNLEDEIDLVHTVQDKIVEGKFVHKELVSYSLANECDKRIDKIQEHLAQIIMNAYKNNKITKSEFVRRNNVLNKYISTENSLENIKEMMSADKIITPSNELEQ